jgi:hypothetical protein
MNESYTLDSPVEYRVKEPETVTEARIRALGAQRQAHIDLAAAIQREIRALKREVDKSNV